MTLGGFLLMLFLNFFKRSPHRINTQVRAIKIIT